MMKKLKSTQGITLIALVVTIIVLIILAGVSISLVLGEDGIIAKAKQSSKLMDEAIKEEQRDLKIMESIASQGWTGEIAEGFANQNEEGVGNTENPYKITNAEELAHFIQEVNNGNKFTGQTVEIINSINMGGKSIEPAGLGQRGTKAEDAFVQTTTYFEGILDGNNNTISNLNINEEDMHGVGLIGVLEEAGEVKNLNIYNGNITGRTAVGAIAGASRGKITNCHNIGTKVTAVDDESISNSGQMAGGISGLVMRGTIESCSNTGEITTKDSSKKTGRGKYCGGIVGYSPLEANLIIKSCKNSGKITCEYQQVGGIIGASELETAKLIINDCQNEGEVKTIKNGTLFTGLAGGIVGLLKSGEISNCNNTGTITSNRQQAGGIAGSLVSGEISNCNNTGTIITNIQQAGGIAGSLESGEIKDCCNYGEIKSRGENGEARCITGGIVGIQLGGTTKRVYNEGKVESENAEGQEYDVTGGIIGFINGGELKDSYNKGTVTGGDYNGEIVGNNDVANSILNCYYYLPQGSTMQGVGVSRNGGDTNGTTGNTDYLFNSLQEFLTYFQISTIE